MLLSFLSICCVSLSVTAFAANADTDEQTRVVYVSADGSDDNLGTEKAPYRTFGKALSVANVGEINVPDTQYVLTENVTFSSVTLTFAKGSTLFAAGYELIVKEDVILTNEITVFGGGTSGTTISGDTNVALYAGTYTAIYGGSYQGKVTGDTNLYVGGKVNADIGDAYDHDGTYYIFGGGFQDIVYGQTNLTFTGDAKANYVYGGAKEINAIIYQGTNVNVSGGSAVSVYGGSYHVDSKSGSNTIITGGTFEQIFGGNYNADMTGNVDLRILGGTISRRVYGGCYNDTKSSGLSYTFSSTYCVNGNVELTLGGKADIDYSYSDGLVTADKGVYARSRYNADVETTSLVFADETAYTEYQNGQLKLTAQDTIMKGIMGDLSVADEIHYYMYALTGQEVTQTCAYHSEHSATATYSVSQDVYVYTGDVHEPISCSIDAQWEYDQPNISYENNTEIGRAKYRIAIGQVCVDGEFAIVDVPEILGGSVRRIEPCGLRFQSKVSEKNLGLDASFGTLIIPKRILNGATLTAETAKVQNIVQTQWATDSVKSTENYEQGYAYFNAVLVGIPENYFDEVLVARSYLCVNGVYCYSEPIERSIAQVAAYALQDGYTDKILYDYVDKGLGEAEIGIAGNAVISVNTNNAYVLTENKGYAALWSTSDERIAEIDRNGKLVAKSVGSVTITAKIGTRTVTYTVTILPVEMPWGDWEEFVPDRENTMV